MVYMYKHVGWVDLDKTERHKSNNRSKSTSWSFIKYNFFNE